MKYFDLAGLIELGTNSNKNKGVLIGKFHLDLGSSSCFGDFFSN